MTRSVAQSLCLLLIVLAGGQALAEDDPGTVPVDPGIETPAEAPAEAFTAGALEGADDGVLLLSLRKALQMGAEFNLRLRESSYEAPIAYQGRLAAEGAFDTLLTGELSAAHTESPSTNLFTGRGTIDEDDVTGVVGATRLLRSGGSVALLYSADRVNTSNPFTTINPAVAQGLSVEVSHPLLRGAGDVALADIRRAQNNVVLAKAGHRTLIEDTLLTIAEAYWNLVFADNNLVARRKSEDVARELLTDASSRLEAEVGTPLEVAEARAGVEARRSDVLQAENVRGSIEDQLLSLIMPFGPQVRQAIRVTPTDTPATNPSALPTKTDQQRYVQLALRGRPEMLASHAEIATRGIDVKVANDAIRPQLDVVGRVATNALRSNLGGGVEDLAGGKATSGSIGLQFSMFVGQRSARASWLAAAWRRRQALIRRKDLENRIVVQVRAALRDLDTARGQLGAGTSEVAATDEDLRGERLKLDNGKSTPFRVLQKEENLTAARTRASRAASDLSIAEARLYRAVGNLAESFQIDVAGWRDCCGSGR